MQQSQVLSIGQLVSFQSVNFPNMFIRHAGFSGLIQPISESEVDQKDATFKVVAALDGRIGNYFSFESINLPGYYLRHAGFILKLNQNDGTDIFAKDASYQLVEGLAGKGVSFESSNFPGRFIRHQGFALKVDPDENSEAYQEDASFLITGPKYAGDTFTDERDGQVYKTVKLKDGKIWLAQNLNFEVENSWCYENDPENGKKYGRLYNWEAALAACPKGWHLPSDEEWWNMIQQYGLAYNDSVGQPENAGADAGKAAFNALVPDGNSGFLGLLGGSLYPRGGQYYSGLGFSSGYWSSTGGERPEDDGCEYGFDKEKGRVTRYVDAGKDLGYYCRYIQN